MMIEEWKPIPGYEGFYEASTAGRIRSVYRYKRILKPMISNTGYERVDLFVKKDRKQCSVHRLVAMTFIPNPDNKPFVNHKDETKRNNSVDNLEWVNHVENCNYGTAIKRRTMHTDYKNRRVNNKHQIEVASKPIIQCDANWNPIREWPSIIACANGIGMSPSGISSAIRRRSTTRNGYRFMEVSICAHV